MNSTNPYLTLLLDAPMQSWGYQSKFDRRTSFSQPTRSGIFGMLCAAMGIDRNDTASLADLANLKLTVYTFHLEGRLTDFHTVGGGWDKKRDKRHIVPKADGSGGDTVVTYREYLQQGKFGVLLQGPCAQLEKIAAALENPCWGVWLGRKACIPAAPIMQGIFDSSESALKHLRCQISDEADIERVCTEVDSFEDGTDTIMDNPINFRTREFAPRRIAVK